MNTIHRSKLGLKFSCLNFKSLNKPVATAVGLRLGLGIIAFFAYFLYPQSEERFFPNPNPDTPDISVFYNRMLTMWSNWDGRWYLQIAQEGYQANPDSQVFSPLYPLLIRGLGKLLFGEYLLAGVIISTVMAVVTLVVFYEMVKRDYDERLAEESIFYLAIFPTVFYLFAVYTEALFLALILGSIFAARHQRKWWLSGILGAFAALARNLGVFVVFSLFTEWLIYRYSLAKKETGTKINPLNYRTFREMFHPTIFAVGLPIVAFGVWLVFNQLAFGDTFGSVTSQSNWQREFTLPWITILESLRVVFTPSSSGFPVIKIDWYQGANLLNLSFFVMGWIMFLYGCWKLMRGQFPLSYLLFFGIGLLIPLMAPVNFNPLLSYPRFLLPLFPMFILWSQVCQHRNWLHFVTLYVWLPLLGLLFTLFANGFWVA